MKLSTKEFFTKPIVVCLLAILCCMLWGSAAPSIKMGYRLFAIASDDTSSQLVFAGIRFFLAGAIVVFVGSLLNKHVLLPKKGNVKYVLFLGMVQTIAQYIFFYISLAHTTGVKASIIQGANAFIALLLASLILKWEKLTISKVFGCIAGFLGVVLINLTGDSIDMSFRFIGEGFLLISMLANAFAVIMIKQFSKKEDTYTLCGYQFMFGGIVLATIGSILGGKLTGFSMSSTLLLVYLGFLSAIAYTVWSLLLKYNSVGKVTIFSFATPVFGVLFSFIMLGESKEAFGLRGMIALILISVGIITVNRKSNKLVK